MPLHDPPGCRQHLAVRPATELSAHGSRCNLLDEYQRIRVLVAKCEAEIAAGQRRRLPGQAAFLDDGRVLCRDRLRGDSRYPYGRDGMNFWVNASGAMHGNIGLFFLFLPPQEGQEPSIAFFAGSRRGGQQPFRPLSLLPTPYLSNETETVINRYTVFGHDAVYFIAETDDVLGVVRVFVDQPRTDHPHIHFSTLLCNPTDRPLDVFLSTYMNPFCRHQFAPTNEDRWFKEIKCEGNTQSPEGQQSNRSELVLPPFVVTTNEDVSRFRSISNFALIRRVLHARRFKANRELAIELRGNGKTEEGDIATTERILVESKACTSRLLYIGASRRQLNTSAFLDRGRFDRDVEHTVFNDVAVAGDLVNLRLPVDSCIRADYVFSVPEDRKILEIEKQRPISREGLDQALEAIRRHENEPGELHLSVHEASSAHIDAEAFNHFVRFLKKQVAVCAQLKGYMHPSPNSLIGFRDVFQAIEGHLFDRPNEARAKILEAMDYVLTDGRCPRQYSLPVNGTTGRADLREFIDQGAWVISAVHTYLATTGDEALLQAPVRFHRLDHSNDEVILPSSERSTVLDHLLRIMDYLARHRDPETGLVLAMYGDWNDALDGLGTPSDECVPFGTGVSVMTSLQLLANCAEMIDILSSFDVGEHRKELERYRNLADQLRDGLLRFAVVSKNGERRVVHGWGDNRRYLVGSFSDSDGRARDGLTSNAFWVLCDMLDTDASMKADILAAFDRLDSPLGLKTFEPGFGPDAIGVGRITKLPLGAAENGAVYVHATAFGIAAQFRMGRAKDAWEQIAKILPFSSHHNDPSHSPFVMPNSYVHNPELNLTGQSMNDWQTGCSNVLLKILIRQVAGFDPQPTHLRVAPADWMPFKSLSLEATYRGRRLRILLVDSDDELTSFHLNGSRLPAVQRDPVSNYPFVNIGRDTLIPHRINEIIIAGRFHVDS